jgi:hypothetical protein
MRRILDRAAWREESEFPASQDWADEAERVLSFLVVNGVFGHFLPAFLGRERQFKAALAEARTAFFSIAMDFVS